MREIRIGDRYKGASTWEVVGHKVDNGTYPCVSIEEGMKRYFKFSSLKWEYLGNFAKANHFETLYNLLNG